MNWMHTRDEATSMWMNMFKRYKIYIRRRKTRRERGWKIKK